MNDPQRLAGTYSLGLEPIYVSIVDDELRLRLTGTPEHLAARLVSRGDSYVVVGSQFDGANVDFTDGDPAPGGRFGGVVEFTRNDGHVESPTGRGLRLEDVEWDPREEEAYEELANHILEHREGLSSEWSLPWPKWHFIEWLTRRGDFIFHGSPLPDIETFAPRRTSVEIMDQGGSGNRAAVYGTPFGLWAMWFAVIDRTKIKGSIRNGVMSWNDPMGRPVPSTGSRFTMTMWEATFGEPGPSTSSPRTTSSRSSSIPEARRQTSGRRRLRCGLSPG